jgi:mono/diheme cytochrome c family protein
MRRLLVSFLCLAFWAAALPAAAQVPARKTILDGVFSAAQVTQGKTSFVMHCSSCHSEDLSGRSAPALKGPQFIDNWREYGLDTLFTYIKENMPRGKDKLSEQTYIEVLAHILDANEYPPGTSELTRDAISAIRFVGKNGAAPVPDNALVQIVGCLTQRDDGVWLLTTATDPIRLRMGNEGKATQDELKASAAQPLGSKTFRLVYPDFEPGFDVNSHKSQKMLGKGYFLINPTDQRLSVTWMGAVQDRCEQ